MAQASTRTTAILSALPQEQAGLLDLLEQPREVLRAGRLFRSGALCGQPVVLALARIGKVAAATTATTLIEAFGAQRILFTGVAGGIGDGVRVGDVVVATHFVQHDMDASPLFERFEIPLYQRTLFACDTRLGGLLLEASRAVLVELAPAADTHAGLVASGDRFVSTAGEADALKEALQAAGLRALAVEMEGAAVAQVCHDYGLPFAAVRTISDRADDEAAHDFQHFVQHVASAYATGIVRRFMQALSSA